MISLAFLLKTTLTEMHFLLAVLPGHAFFLLEEKKNKTCKQILSENNQMTKEAENAHDFFLTQGRSS